MVVKRKTRKQKKSRRKRAQIGGGPQAFIAVFTKIPLTKEQVEEIRKQLETKFTSVKVAEIDLSGQFEDVEWGYTRLPKAERANVIYFELEEGPAYLMNHKCSGDDRLTKLEGEVDEALEPIEYSLVPIQHGLTDSFMFYLVGVRAGKKGILPALQRVDYLSRC